MPSLKFVALQNNFIETIGSCFAFLNDLEFLDLSHNKIEAISLEEDLPPTIMFLKLRGNPIANNPFKYR